MQCASCWACSFPHATLAWPAGEDALANVSVELRPGTTKIKGHVRIRSKTQGVALSLGERITARMKVYK